MALPIRAERAQDLTPAEADEYWVKMYRTPTTVTIAGGILTTTGWGWYALATEGAAALDELDKILGVPHGEEVLLSLANPAQHVLVRQGTFLDLANGEEFLLRGRNMMRLKSFGGDVLVEMPGGRVHIGPPT
jgi:hypothetical protein